MYEDGGALLTQFNTASPLVLKQIAASSLSPWRDGCHLYLKTVTLIKDSHLEGWGVQVERGCGLEARRLVKEVFRVVTVGGVACSSPLYLTWKQRARINFLLLFHCVIFFLIFTLYWSIVDLQHCVSGVQQSDLVIHIHISILFQVFFPYRLLQSIE